MTLQIHEHDIVVIGAGGAGLSAAISAAEKGADVGVVCKSLLGKAHTVMAEGGIAASLGNVAPDDDWRSHFLDTMKGGWGLNDFRMAETHAKEAPERVRELESWGAVFDRTKDGKISQRNFGGHRYTRLAHVGDRTGLELIRTLQDRAVALGIQVYMEYTITELLKDSEDEKIAGAFGYWRITGLPVLFRAKKIILATGGSGMAYKINSSSWEYTGDGPAMALRTGAELMDMEFVQFHPTGMVWPKSVQGTLVTEGVRGEGGILKNSDGERFMFNYIPDAYVGSIADTEEEADRWASGDASARPPPELLTRDVVARAILNEVSEGRGSEHGGAYLDIASRKSVEFILQKLPAMYHQFKELAGVDITKDSMEVAPTCHYMMGGIRVDPDTQETCVSGLYASGEAAGGLHGANRLGGNSLSDLLVFGNRAGIHAGKTAKDIEEFSEINEDDLENALDHLEFPFLNSADKGEHPFRLREELHEIMEEYVGIKRDETGLKIGLKKLEGLKTRTPRLFATGMRTYNAGWQTCFDLINLIDVSIAIAHSALKRKESRGAHSRVDFPVPTEALGKTKFIISLKNDKVKVSKASVPVPRKELLDMIQKDQKKEDKK